MRLRRRSIIVKITGLLLLMLVVTIVNVATIYFYQHQQKHDARIVNVAGRQRMLSQRIAKLALSMANGNDSDRKLLSEAVGLYDSSLKTLRYGGRAMEGGIPPAPKTMEELFQKNENLWIPFKENAGIIAKESRDNKDFIKGIEYIRLNNDKILKVSNLVTLAFDEEFSRKVLFLRGLLFATLGMSILFFIIGYFIAVKIVKPLNILSATAAKVGAGDLTAKAQVVTKDEIGVLATSFNKMTEDLSKKLVSKDYVDNIIKSMIDTLIVTDHEGNIKTVNQATLDLLGYEEQEIIGQPAGILFAAAAAEEEEEEEEHLFKGKRLEKLVREGSVKNFNMTYKTKAGMKIPVILSGSVMRSKDGNLINIVIMAHDITEQKKAEEKLKIYNQQLEDANWQLKESEDEWNKFFDLSLHLLVIARLDGHIKRINPGWTEVLGYTAEELIGTSFFELVHPDDRAATLAEMDKLSTGIATLYFENRYRCKDDSYRLLAWAAVPHPEAGLVYAIAEDITERKKFDEELKEAKIYTENIIKSMTDFLIVTDHEGNIKTVNQAALNLLGYEEKELVGQPAGILFAEEEEEEEEEEEHFFKGKPLDKLIAEGSVKHFDMTYKTKAGEKIPVSFAGSVMREAGCPYSGPIADCPTYKEKGMHCEKFLGIVGIARDMRELKKLQAELIQKGKISSVGELGAGIAHELNSPLSGLYGLIEVMQKRLDKTDRNSLLLEKMKEATGFCMKIIENLLTFSRKSTGTCKPVDCNKAINVVLSFIKHLIDVKKIEVTTDLSSRLRPVKGDVSQLQQVFLNIIRNACDFLPQGGKIMIRTSNLKQSRIRISINDTGVGVPLKNQKDIFEPFFSTKSNGRGIGLGLSLSKEILERYKGNISVKSKLGSGATFIITLPALKNGKKVAKN